MADSILIRHTTRQSSAKASSRQWTAHLIFTLASDSSHGRQHPRGTASRFSTAIMVSSSLACLSFKSLTLSSYHTLSSCQSGTSSGVAGLSVGTWSVMIWLTFMRGCAAFRSGNAGVSLGFAATLLTLPRLCYAGETLPRPAMLEGT